MALVHRFLQSRPLHFLSSVLSRQHQDGVHVDERGHVQDGLLPTDPGAGAVLDLRPAASVRGLRHPLPSLLLQPLPAEARFPRGSPDQCQGALRPPPITRHAHGSGTWAYTCPSVLRAVSGPVRRYQAKDIS